MLKLWFLLILNHNSSDTKSATKNKWINLLPELRGFKFVTALVLELKKIENNDKKIQYFLFKLESRNN